MKNNLKSIRMKEYMLSKKEFANLLDIKPTTYYNWENGFNIPSLEVALKIANKLNRPVTDIWYLD